ncbi:PD-(D/E)XK nuclease-like domain-containing protein [Azospirillum doebereinerae]|uniref:PD-(D/E)XK nuclease-like domain-containing protein n=1 Tax=Azospirillum doebereinerae TaxID=92933 RepID=UPI001EE56208|nr:PD-(D/E)XK nuclease-like domain-containing protein [Azospirillum doebereinerae]MCG5241362.1 PD-(D/E)XK nuclease-like domain-containing protein [Azospirillum doebereinerae]
MPFENLDVGIYDGIPAAIYHAAPALSSGGIKTLIQECPAVFWHEHMNPDAEETDDTKFDIGTVAHLVWLEPHLMADRLVPIDADSYRSKDAQATRAAAKAAGKTPLLKKHMPKIEAMRAMLERELPAGLMRGGAAERSYVWRDPKTGVAMKARPDWVQADNTLIVDYKTSASAKPATFERRIWDVGHHIQARDYLDGHLILTRKRARWLWVVQATEAPFLVSVFEPTPGLLEMAAEDVRDAIDTFAECSRSGEWPSYTRTIQQVGPPPWATAQHEERKYARQLARQQQAERAANSNSSLHERSIAFQAPIGA